jgi:hypothetical protein
MLIAALFTTANGQEKPKSLSMDDRINKMKYTYTILCSFNKEEIHDIHCAWINLDDAMLSEISQSQKRQML